MYRVISIYLLISYCCLIFSQISVFGLTSGPKTPDFNNFTPVGATELVNLFTGDLNYNLPVIEIPGPHGSGYALSLSYDSGVSPESEASWVGFGWTLNPGAINRNLRGFPDEFNGESVQYYNKTRPIWTVASTKSVATKVWAQKMGINLSHIDRINNYTGYQPATNLGVNIFGGLGVNVTLDQNGWDDITFSPYVNPFSILSTNLKQVSNFLGNKLSFDLYPEIPKPYGYSNYSGISLSFSCGTDIYSAVPVGVHAGLEGGFDFKTNEYLTHNSIYGYLNSRSGSVANRLCDYYVEKNYPYDSKDVFLGIPFNSNDQFVVTGEGPMGSFRPYVNNIVHYAPNKVGGRIDELNLGLTLDVGGSSGLGLNNLGKGSQYFRVTEWIPTFGGGGEALYRFSNDRGGIVSYTDNTKLETVQITSNGLYGFKNVDIEGVKDYSLQKNLTGSTTYIDKNSDGFIITNKEGVKYCYEQPVYVRNETSISVDVRSMDVADNNYFAFRALPLVKDGSSYKILNEDLYSDKLKTVVGTISPSKYANDYLLTSVLNAGYKDVDDNGPTDNDLGGWTKFHYREKYGDKSGKWYRYRNPFYGLLYSQNSISDVKDDVGSVTTGEKEVFYLKAIETKSHIAVFVTNKTGYSNKYLKSDGEDRLDGLSASALTSSGDPDASIGSSNQQTGKSDLEFLEKIVLFPKNPGVNGDDVESKVEGQKPLKTVCFKYNYNLVPNVGNNRNANFNYRYQRNSIRGESEKETQSGKLTLEKVWLEYEGTSPVKISPYVFKYFYPTTIMKNYFSDCKGFSGGVQNPSYAPDAIDPWGNMMPKGKERIKAGVPWIDQSAYVENEDAKDKFFDPAAYHLKSVQLPSGASLYFKYESKDYAYVQDRSAMAMARLKQQVSIGDKETYLVNVADLGVDPTDGLAITELAAKITDYFNSDKCSGKVYYKFLFALIGGNPSLDNARSEYIDGYADFIEAKAGSGCIEITLGNTLTTEDGDRALTPHGACREFVLNQRLGKIDDDKCIEPYYEQKYDKVVAEAADLSQKSDDLFENFLNNTLKYGVGVGMITDLSASVAPLLYKIPDESEVGVNINLDQSFIKLPVLNRKYGGGTRVKSVYMHDPGISTQEEVVLGTNYRYVLEDGVTSSGVATNEPQKAREENPLVDFIQRKGQSKWEQLISGKNKEQTEGPIGESILPSAMIGYSRVVVENIHTGKTGNGFTVHDFYTTKDYAYDRLYADEASDKTDFYGEGFEKSLLNDFSDMFDFGLPLYSYSSDRLWATQGFRFIKTNMNGKIKKVSTYVGSYESSKMGNWCLTGFDEYEYFAPGEKIKRYYLNASGDVEEDFAIPGKEMDICRETKKVVDERMNFKVEAHVDVGLYPPPPIFVPIALKMTYSDNELFSYSISKIIDYPAILKKVTSMKDGIESKSENLVFNKTTGDPMVVKKTGCFQDISMPGGEMHEGNYYSVRIPGHWKYSNMGQKNINKSNTNQLDLLYGDFLVYDEFPTPEWFGQPSNLVKANIQTYEKLSDYSNLKVNSLYDEVRPDPVWIADAAYQYKSSLSAGKVIGSGKFGISSPAMDIGSDWTKLHDVVLYSPNGDALEETDVLGNSSAVLYGEQYQNSVPTMVAYNCEYNGLYFNDYENSDGAYTLLAHSGKGSMQLSNISKIVDNTYLTSTIKDGGAVFKCWVHFIAEFPDEFKLNVNGAELSYDFEEVCQVQDWYLYSIAIPANAFSSMSIGDPVNLAISASEIDESSVLIDDVRFQAQESKVTCYVYDTDNLRLLAQFDDQHFGQFYQYNQEGHLISKVVETSRGKKIVQQMNYNTYKENR